MKAGILTRLRIFFGRATRNDLLNLYYDAKMRHDYKEVRDIGNKIFNMHHKNFAPDSYYAIRKKYLRALVDEDKERCKMYHNQLLEMDKKLFKKLQ